MTQTPRKFGGTVFLICTILLASAALRLATGLGDALASGQSEEAPLQAETNQERVMDTDQLNDLLQDLLIREKSVSEREEALLIREQELAFTKQNIEATLDALVKAEEELAATLATADGAEEADLARLTAVYENMKPKDAAPIFQQMAPEFAAGFLARMRPDAAAAIVSGLEPDVAYAISVILANRNRDVPKN
ncbi:MotE family protein [Nereida sp. MMG025]|uniref:MotE family protein n=1 Tax=Nereida sp. MMG025 TaxID=2909981 RepID=UPI001F276D30|nr:hypothetical protein [Nereida sp. MMG025]MCF6444668.1 hypothetical protein [Nereida sp. MMG025]